MITIYTTPTCGFCHMAKEYFRSKKVEFKEKDVSQDPQLQQEMIALSGQMGTPVIDIDGTVVLGFDRTSIDAVLRQKKLV